MSNSLLRRLAALAIALVPFAWATSALGADPSIVCRPYELAWARAADKSNVSAMETVIKELQQSPCRELLASAEVRLARLKATPPVTRAVSGAPAAKFAPESPTIAAVRACSSSLGPFAPEEIASSLSSYPTGGSDESEGICKYALTLDSSNATMSMYARSLYSSGKFPEALAWFEKSADAGSIDSQLVLGYYYSYFKDKSPELSLKYLGMAANAKSAEAAEYLGDIYQIGRVVPTDYAMSRNYYQQAARFGSARAGYKLGQLYQFGLGGPVDIDRARALYMDAVTSGVEGASQALDNLRR